MRNRSNGAMNVHDRLDDLIDFKKFIAILASQQEGTRALDGERSVTDTTIIAWQFLDVLTHYPD